RRARAAAVALGHHHSRLRHRERGHRGRRCLDRELCAAGAVRDRKSTRLNSSHLVISYAVFCLKKKKHHFNNLVSVLYVSRVVSNNKIYGRLGLVPVLIIRREFGWTILLFGAQVPDSFQPRDTY